MPIRKGTKIHYPCIKCGTKFPRNTRRSKICPLCREEIKLKNAIKVRKFYKTLYKKRKGGNLHSFLNRA